jgi:hypothetical protein
MSSTGTGTRRFGRVAPAAALALGCLLLVLVAAGWPLARLAHQSLSATGGGPPIWLFGPFGLVGFVVAWRKPLNPLGWVLADLAVAGAFSQDGSFYAVADYRLRHGTLPLGWVAMLAQPGWAIALALIGLAVLLFPEGKLASPRLRVVLWLYLAFAATWMVSAYALTVDAIVSHDIRVDSGGNLVALSDSASSSAWWNVLQSVGLATLVLCFAVSLVAQVVSYLRSSGERRQQLKWLLGGFAACLAGILIKFALSAEHGWWGAVGNVAIAGIFTIPVTMGVAILKYRLYDIDRILSRTLAYAIVTGLLIGVYAGLVLLATEVIGLHSSVAVAVATLAAAALFAPVRRRVQRVVDRRFNRARYDAEQTVAAFAARLKDAVDLDTVRDDLTGVIQAALEPAHIAVWTSRPDLAVAAGGGRCYRPRYPAVGRAGAAARVSAPWRGRVGNACEPIRTSASARCASIGIASR